MRRQKKNNSRNRLPETLNFFGDLALEKYARPTWQCFDENSLTWAHTYRRRYTAVTFSNNAQEREREKKKTSPATDLETNANLEDHVPRFQLAATRTLQLFEESNHCVFVDALKYIWTTKVTQNNFVRAATMCINSLWQPKRHLALLCLQRRLPWRAAV